jgi:hypothetical protein
MISLFFVGVNFLLMLLCSSFLVSSMVVIERFSQASVKNKEAHYQVSEPILPTIICFKKAKVAAGYRYTPTLACHPAI